MANKNTASFDASNNSLITTNGVGDISGADANAMFKDVSDSFLNKNKTVVALANDASTWDINSFDSANALVTITGTTHTIELSNLKASGIYYLYVVKSNALDLDLTITSTGATVHEINGSILEGASNQVYIVQAIRTASDLYVYYFKPLRILDDASLGALALLDTVSSGEIDDDSVTNVKLANMTAYTVKGRLASTGDPQDLTKSDLQSGFDMVVSGNNGNVAIILEPGSSVYDFVDGLFRVQHATFSTSFEVNGGDFTFLSDEGTYRKKIVVDSSSSQQISLEIRNKSTNALIQSVILDSNGLRRGVASSGSDSLEIVERGALSIYALKPTPAALTDGASISWDWGNGYFDLATLTTTNTTITLTLSNIVAGANQMLSIVKNTASDVTITLAGTGLTFYGADYNTTPVLVLSGVSGDIFDISFLARTTTDIGVVVAHTSQKLLVGYPGLAPAVIPIANTTSIRDAISILEKATVLNSAVGTKVGTKFTDDFSRASLGSSYTIVGSFTTAAIVSNKLRLEHLGSPDWSRYVYRNDFPSSDLLSTIEADIDLVDITPANAGIGIRLHGYNSGRDYSCRLFTNGSPGRLDIQFDDGSAGQVPSTAYLAISQGDSITLRVSVYKNSMFFNAKNNTTNKSVFAQRDFPVDLTETYRQPNRWQQGIQMFAGIYDITRLEYNSDQRLFADICFVGDSLTVGYNNIDYFDVWRLQVAEELNRTHATIAGGGNTTQDILDVLYEIIAIQPTNVVMMIGQNDVNQSVALSTIQTNITSIVDQLEAEGINVVLLANIPNGNTDQKDLADWILSTYPTQSVDMYYRFLQTTSTTIAEVSYINSSHWTPLGNDIAAKVLTDELPNLLV